MNIEKELAAHAKATAALNNKFARKFSDALEKAFNTKARNIEALDKIAIANKELDTRIGTLQTALAITDPNN